MKELAKLSALYGTSLGHICWPYEIGHGPKRDAGVAQCYACGSVLSSTLMEDLQTSLFGFSALFLSLCH